MDKKEKIKNKIVKLHAKYTKMQNHPSNISLYWFMPLAIVLPILIGIPANMIFTHFATSLVSGILGVGITAGLMYQFSSEYYETRLNRAANKLIDLEYALIDKYGFDKDGDILSVPADKVKEYLDGEYKLTQSYWVEYNNEFAIMTTQEIENFRKQGFEFYKYIDRLRVLNPNEVKKLVAKGYTVSRDGIYTVFTKDGKELELDCNKSSYIGPSYNRELTKEEQKDKECLISSMIAKDKKSNKAVKKDEIIDHGNDTIIKLD